MTSNRLPGVLPPIVKVIVEVPTVEVCVHVYCASRLHVAKTLIVVRFDASEFVTEKFTMTAVPSAMLPVPISVRVLKARSWPVFVSTAPLFTVKVPVAVMAEEAEIVPPITRL